MMPLYGDVQVRLAVQGAFDPIAVAFVRRRTPANGIVEKQGIQSFDNHEWSQNGQRENP